jgi:hypothetical protein
MSGILDAKKLSLLNVNLRIDLFCALEPPHIGAVIGKAALCLSAPEHAGRRINLPAPAIL